MKQASNLRTIDVAELIGVHRDTLLRWFREGRVEEPSRDRNGWRLFKTDEVEKVLAYAKQEKAEVLNGTGVREDQLLYEPYHEQIVRLKELDWDFVTANTEYLNHSIHPYPCKFIPQIPNALIQALSSVGETVLDPFCGSGTSLVEALRLHRNAVGVDANPIAALISKAKCTRLTVDEEETLIMLAQKYLSKGENTSYGQLSIFNGSEEFKGEDADVIDPWISEWFSPDVIKELKQIRKDCYEIDSESARVIALSAFSAIVVNVSMQDSDTRYVRRDKKIGNGEVFTKFGKSLSFSVKQTSELAKETNPRNTARIMSKNILSNPEIPRVQLVVCSPPYPNAYSYHLYHRSRMLWLGMDPDAFKREEIGSHRKYSAKGKNSANEETFRGEIDQILKWVKMYLDENRHACFVVGDSIISGKGVKNDEILRDVAERNNFIVDANIERNLLQTKKCFNPKIGKIRDEHIVILRNIK